MNNLLAETEMAANWMVEIVRLVLPAVFGFLVALLGLWIWHFKKMSEPRYYLNQKRLDALLKAWSLLAYITETENPKSVLIWEKDGKDTKYYLRPQQAKDYITSLSETFYGDGYGLLLGRDIKSLFYEYRSLSYKVLNTVSEQSENIRLKNDKLAERMREIYNELNSKLREKVEKIEDGMGKTK
jgi:gas vesicle protein